MNGVDSFGQFTEYQYHQLAKENLSNNRKFDDKISGYINGQDSYPYNKMYYGSKNLGYNGCELIAIYNAFYKLGKNKNLSSIIYDFEYNGKMWMYGFFGTKQSEIGQYLLKNKLKYKTFTLTKKMDAATLKNDSVCIISYLHSGAMVHTVMVRRLSNKKILVYNRYSNRRCAYTLNSIHELVKIDGYKMIIGYYIYK